MIAEGEENKTVMKYSETSYRMKQRLAQALGEILMQKSFNKITVGDIVTLCGVNRKTFYYHFSDIHALLCWMFHEGFGRLMESNREAADFVVVAHSIMDYIAEHEAAFNNLVDTVGEDSLKRALEVDVRSLQDEVVHRFETVYGVSFEEPFRSFLVKFLTDAITGVLMDWIRGRKYQCRENTIEYLRDIFRSTIPGLIERGMHLKG